MEDKSHGNTVNVCVYREFLDRWREDHGLPPTYDEKVDNNLAYLEIPEKVMQEYLHDVNQNPEAFFRKYTAEDTTDLVDWLNKRQYSIKEANMMANENMVAAEEEKKEISPKVKGCIEYINETILEQANAGQAIFQQGEQAIEASHAPMLVYGQFDGTIQKADRNIPTFKEDELKTAAFTGGAAVYLSSLGLKDPRFMPASEAFFSPNVKVNKNAKQYQVPMYNKNKKTSYVQKFINFADLEGKIIDKDFSKVIDPKLDQIHQAVLRNFAQRKSLNKPYEAGYYAHRDVLQVLSHQNAEKKAAVKPKEAAPDPKKEAYKQDCAPYMDEFNKRVAAVREYQGAPLTPESLPQDRFMQVMHDSMGKTNANGKRLSYAYQATKALYEAKVPKDVIVACINNYAPEAAKDPARMKAYGTKYADFLTARVEKSRSYQAKHQAAMAR